MWTKTCTILYQYFRIKGLALSSALDLNNHDGLLLFTSWLEMRNEFLDRWVPSRYAGLWLCIILLWQHCISHFSNLVFCTLAHLRRKEICSEASSVKTGIATVCLVGFTHTYIRLLKETQMDKWSTQQDCTSPAEAKMSCIFKVVLCSHCTAI